MNNLEQVNYFTKKKRKYGLANFVDIVDLDELDFYSQPYAR